MSDASTSVESAEHAGGAPPAPRPMAAVSFYTYLFKRQKRLFFKSIFVVYVLPVLLELLPCATPPAGACARQVGGC